MSVINLTNKYIDDLWDLRDKRMDQYYLMSSPWYTIGLCSLYVVLVTIVGPLYMRNRSPFGLKKAMMVHNIFMVVYSLWLLKMGLQGGWWRQYSYRCEPIDYSDNPQSLLMAKAFYFFYFGRFIEFFDTFFFVLRKKNNQITFLHVSHHAIMPIFTWIFVRYMPGGHASFAGLLNAIIHIIMYGYYFLAALGPQFQRFLWWKRYMTQMQIIQFFLIFYHSLQLFWVEDCGMPYQYAYAICSLMIFFIVLFTNFYVQSYFKRTNGQTSVNSVKSD